jgi:hypothetical protein
MKFDTVPTRISLADIRHSVDNLLFNAENYSMSVTNAVPYVVHFLVLPAACFIPVVKLFNRLTAYYDCCTLPRHCYLDVVGGLACLNDPEEDANRRLGSW